MSLRCILDGFNTMRHAFYRQKGDRHLFASGQTQQKGVCPLFALIGE